MPGARILMYLYVEDVSGVTGVVALGIYRVVVLGVPGLVTLSEAANGITVAVSSVLPDLVYLRFDISVPN